MKHIAIFLAVCIILFAQELFASNLSEYMEEQGFVVPDKIQKIVDGLEFAILRGETLEHATTKNIVAFRLVFAFKDDVEEFYEGDINYVPKAQAAITYCLKHKKVTGFYYWKNGQRHEMAVDKEKAIDKII